MDPYQVVRNFETALCAYTGARYCVTVDSCTNALFLALTYQKACGVEVVLPKYTYPGVANAVVHAGGKLRFTEPGWDSRYWQRRGWYCLEPLAVIDSAKYLSRHMCDANPLFYQCQVCVSFHARKPLPIGRGGAILTMQPDAAEWFRLARFDGRNEVPLHEDVLQMPGWNMYMTPEQAARGLQLLSILRYENVAPEDPYQDLSQYTFYTKANRNDDSGNEE